MDLQLVSEPYVKPHYPGELAYWDTLRGLVPCRVLEVRDRELGPEIKIRVTETTGAWKINEERWEFSRVVVPRSSIRKQEHTLVIRHNYVWRNQENKP